MTLVDAKHFRAQLAEPQAAEAMQQVAYADVILLNKTDLVVRRRRSERVVCRRSACVRRCRMQC